MQKLSGSYVVEDQDIERATKKSVEDCERECLNDEKCRAIFYVNGFCFIVYKDVPPKPYTGTALYYDKVCTNSKNSKMCFVTTHVNISKHLKFWHSQCNLNCVNWSISL